MADESKNAWHLARDGEKWGPYTSQQLSEMGKEGRITSDMTIWRAGMENWQSVTKVRGLQVTPVVPNPPPAPQVPVIAVAVTPSPMAAPMRIKGHVTTEKTSKSLKMQQLLGLLCIVLGIVLILVGMPNGDQKAPSKDVSPAVMFGSLMLIGGIAWRIVTRMQIWWHHG